MTYYADLTNTTQIDSGPLVRARKLGGDWWRRQHCRSDGPKRPDEGPPPDDLLVAVRANEPRHWPTTLERLAQWAAADVADGVLGSAG